MRLAQYIMTLFFVALLASCGQKGPLYLPEPAIAEELDQQPASLDQQPATTAETNAEQIKAVSKQESSERDSEAAKSQP